MFRRLIIALPALLLPLIMVTAAAAASASVASQPGAVAPAVAANYFYGGYAVHGMTSVPAYPASHGCVRMTVPTMDRMWSSLRAGMPVAIYNS